MVVDSIALYGVSHVSINTEYIARIGPSLLHIQNFMSMAYAQEIVGHKHDTLECFAVDGSSDDNGK